jgi:hypothetical protein
MPLDFEAIRRRASAAAEDFRRDRYAAYLEMIEQVEAWPENQSGADKSWVERADEEHRRQYRAARRMPDAPVHDDPRGGASG